MEDFKFESKTLDYESVEIELCNHYKLGMPQSSNFMEIIPNRSQHIAIFAQKGSISCEVKAYSSESIYEVLISQVKIKRK